jgi:RNA ligase
MQFNPPLILNIEDVLPYIKDNPAFIVADKGWYKVIDYVYAHRDTFTNDIARECRGLKFDSRTGAILARPYHKFHNLDECAGYFSADVDLSLPHSILDKLDGSMVHTCIRPEDGFVFPMTRMGFTNVAEQCLQFLYKNEEQYTDFISLATENPTKTFIFEYVGPNNRIVVGYDSEQLILTGIRDMFTGEYATFMGMQAYLAGRNIPLVKRFDSSLIPSLGIGFIAANIYDDESDTEGSIVRFDSGAMVKIKTDLYCRKHKSKELTESQKGVVQLIVDGTLDDILPQVEEKTQEKLLAYQKAFLGRLTELHEGLRHILSFRKDMDQKTFALDIQAQFPRITQTLLFSTRKSGDGYAELTKKVKAHYNKESELEILLEDLDLPLWQL